MWRKIASVIFVISMIGEAIITLVLMIKFGIWVGLSFLICALVASTFFGMLIGLCDDAAESRELLAHIAYLLRSSNIKTNTDNSASSRSTNLSSRLANSSNAENNFDFWICPDCGAHNDGSSICCKTCGKYK